MITGAVLLAALQVQAGAVGYRHKEAPVMRASPVGDAIVIDGRLDEPDWLEAEATSAFTQLDPYEGAPASERTEVRVLIGDEALYIGARLFDRDPGGIVGRLTRRDFSLDDSDAFQVILDTYHDHLTAFGFTVTPAGAIRDVAIGADGEEDPSWDGAWSAAATTDPLGWTAEPRIPLSEHRRQIEAEWGIQLSRRIVRKQETSFFAFTPKAEQAGVNRYGHLVGLRRLDTPRRLEILPHTVARVDAPVTTERVRGSTPIEPLSNYFVGRVTRELEGNDTQIGLFLSAVHLDLSTADFTEELRSSAYAMGVDLNHAWDDRTWALDLSLAASDMRGSANANLPRLAAPPVGLSVRRRLLAGTRRAGPLRHAVAECVCDERNVLAGPLNAG